VSPRALTQLWIHTPDRITAEEKEIVLSWLVPGHVDNVADIIYQWSKIEKVVLVVILLFQLTRLTQREGLDSFPLEKLYLTWIYNDNEKVSTIRQWEADKQLLPPSHYQKSLVLPFM